MIRSLRRSMVSGEILERSDPTVVRCETDRRSIVEESVVNLSIGSLLVIIGLICWALVVLGVGVDVDLWVLGWIFVVAGALLFDRRLP